MTSRTLLARIAAEPGKMGGKPVIRGRRVTPSMVLNMLANGLTRDDVLKAYVVLESEDIDACLLYAARSSELAAAEGIDVVAARSSKRRMKGEIRTKQGVVVEPSAPRR